MIKKIAIAADNDLVSEHFGHCEGFAVYVFSEGSDVQKTFVSNPGHKPGFLPNFLHDQGVQVIIVGGIGTGAIEIFQEKGIEVFTGAQGSVDTVMRAYQDGTLLSSGSVCHAHRHEDVCGQ